MFGYTQSDEISLLLTDFATIATDAWFGYNIQKMASIAASIATLEFHRSFCRHVDDYANNPYVLESLIGEENDEQLLRFDFLRGKLSTDAFFDARCFSIPKDEVCNCFIWRQQDATRNSIEAVGQANFSAKQLHGKSCDMIQDMLMTEKGINWNNYPTDCKRGSACYRVKETADMEDPRETGRIITVERNRWKIDREIPVFTQDRMFIEKHIEPWRYKVPDFTKHTGNAMDYPN